MSTFVRELPSLNVYKNLGEPNAPSNYRGNAMYMGEPDGPMRFIKSLGMEVPTYIDPRNDLKTGYRNAGAHKSVDYHIPPKMRGPYKPQDLADFDESNHYPTNEQGNVRCSGLKPGGLICQKVARNRTGFCSNHGGALHPADKLFTAERGIMPSTPEKLDRHQKVEMGIIPVSELSDEEIAKGQIRMDNGTFSPTSPALSNRIQSAIRAEFFKRADRFVQENVMDMLKEMRNIALSTVSEDKDKIAAIQWMTERVLGKTPDVIITNKTDSPFETMMGDVLGGSRESYRNQASQPPGGMTVIEGEISNAVTILDQDDDEQEDSETSSPMVLEERNLSNDGNATQAAIASSAAVASNEALVTQKGQAPSGSLGSGDLLPGPGAPAENENDPVVIARKKREIRERRRKARNRRYAAKSRGFNTIEDLPYEVVFRQVKLGGKLVTRMKLIAPEDQKSPKVR